jgi:mRNA interferase MazF
MVKTSYIPERGDIVWIKFNLVLGHEQTRRRPAIVISPKEYNEKVGLGLFCPITSKIKNYPFEVEIKNKKIGGVVLSDQIKSFDWKIREVEFITKATPQKVNEIINKIHILLIDSV